MTDFMRQVRDLVLEAAFWAGGDDPFWAGVFTATVVLLVASFLGRLVNGIYHRWLKGIRRFFEKTRLPGEMPSKQGDSPADVAWGCAWRIGVLVIGLFGVWWVMSRAP